MKDIYRNPTFYYVLVPIIVALWPLLVWAVYLPGAEDNWQIEQKQYLDAQKIIQEILTLAPDRLESGAGKTNADEFDYTTAVDKVARSCEIPSTSYQLASKPMKVSKGRKFQTCHIVLRGVGIAKFARFISTLQLDWASLQCERIVLTKKKGLPDTWKVDLDFKYYH